MSLPPCAEGGIAADEVKGALAFLLPDRGGQPVPFFSREAAAQSRSDAHSVHGSFNQQGAGATERVIQLGVWIDMGDVDDAGCKGFLDRCDDRAFAVASFVQSGAGGIHCNHHLVVVVGKIDRTGAAALLKPADAVRLLEAGDNRLFDNRLAVGDAVQL